MKSILRFFLPNYKYKVTFVFQKFCKVNFDIFSLLIMHLLFVYNYIDQTNLFVKNDDILNVKLMK